jgi:DNA-directed RNA polymerase specialized sigma24 family protein
LIRTELQRLARRHLARERKNHTMLPSSLVQEAFLRLLRGADGWRNRAHFFAVGSQVMRHVLVDYALREGTKNAVVPLFILAVDLALQRSAKIDGRKSRVPEMRFFGGLSMEETAEVLGVAPNKVIRDWSFARAWLRRELGGGGTTECGTLAAN